jgi:hypothetical protein
MRESRHVLAGALCSTLSMYTICPRRHSVPDTQESDISASCPVLVRATLDLGTIVSFADTGVALSASPAACDEDARVSGWHGERLRRRITTRM